MTQLSDILLPSSIITTDNTKILTNKTISGADNTLTSLNASNISTGTVPTARLGSGTADATTYLRGDNTWQVVSGGGGGEWNYEGQMMSTYTTGSSVDLLTHMTPTLSSYLSTYNSVKLNITLQSVNNSSAQIYAALYYRKNNLNTYGKSFVEYNLPTTSSGYYIRQQIWSNFYAYLYYYAMYDYITIELTFQGRHSLSFTDSPSAFQQCVGNVISNQVNTNYGPLRMQSRFQPATVNYTDNSNSFDDFRLISAISNRLIRSTVEVYTK